MIKVDLNHVNSKLINYNHLNLMNFMSYGYFADNHWSAKCESLHITIHYEFDMICCMED